MKEIDLTYIAEKVQLLHPEIPVQVIRHVIKEAFSRIVKVVETGTDDIHLRKCDIMSIFTFKDIQAINAELADLDETKLPTLPQRRAFKLVKEKLRN